MKFRGKQKMVGRDVPHDGYASDPKWAKDFPAIHEYLTVAPGDSGNAAKTATLTIFSEAGMFKICLNDRAEGYSAFASGETVTEALEALEGQLSSGNTDWREAKRKR